MDKDNLQERVKAVRRFNRFYTQKIGVLNEGHLDSPFSLAEVRVLYELVHRESLTASDISKSLGLDAGYLSRILNNFKKCGLITRKRSEADGRQAHLLLTEKGKKTFASLNDRAHDEIATMIGKLSSANQRKLIEAMQTVERVLGGEKAESKVPYIIRSHQPGDMGWVVHRHGVLYSEEYGWGEWFEALVAGVAAKFLKNYDPKKERCWIAEKDGEIVGSVFLTKKSETVAKLRLLLVEPNTRGLGIGSRLVSECERFARQAGYKKIVLWTNSVLESARRIYKAAGYRLVKEEHHDGFGKDSVAETWELKL